MKMKSLLLTFCFLITHIVLFAQDDQYAGATDAIDDDPSGPFSRYGWPIFIGLIAFALIRKAVKDGKI